MNMISLKCSQFEANKENLITAQVYIKSLISQFAQRVELNTDQQKTIDFLNDAMYILNTCPFVQDPLTKPVASFIVSGWHNSGFLKMVFDATSEQLLSL